MKQFAFLIIITLCVFPAFGAGMARIVRIVDGQTIAVEEQGLRSTVRLAGVVVPDADAPLAIDFLRRTTASGWALVERDAKHPGQAWLYRSPDGLSINGEMIRAAYLQPGTRMTYLGEVSPGPRREVTKQRSPRAPSRMSAAKRTPPRRIRR